MLALIAAPYHLGERAKTVGTGPLRVLETGIGSKLAASSTTIDLGRSCSWQDVNNALATELVSARSRNAFPLVLAGNCNSCLGTLAAFQDLQPGILWFDAHGDFHTEHTSISGSLEGMSLALATSRFVPESRVVLVGARELDPGEAERVRDLLLFFPSADLRGAPLPEMTHVYVHVDVDVLDPAVSPGVNCHTPGGLSVVQLLDALAYATDRYQVAAVAITNYNPEKDMRNRTRDIVVQIIEEVDRLRKTAPSR
jgi:arginase